MDSQLWKKLLHENTLNEIEKLNIKTYDKSPNDEVLDYVVYDENTLGYLFKNKSGKLMFGVLKGSGIKGGMNDNSGPIMITKQDEKRLRKATKKDFSDYRVSEKGHVKLKEATKKSKSASKVLKLMDKYEDGDSRYGEFVKKVAKEDGISVKQLEKELEPFI